MPIAARKSAAPAKIESSSAMKRGRAIERRTTSSIVLRFATGSGGIERAHRVADGARDRRRSAPRQRDGRRAHQRVHGARQELAELRRRPGS